MKQSYISPIEIKLDEAQTKALNAGQSVQSWIQVFRPGKWKHPRYGELKFTEDIFDGFVKSFKDRVRGIDLAIDQEHEPEKGAAAWIKDVQNRGAENPNQGLWALVEWTKWGLQLVADKTFRYLSGDFDYTWKDEETGKTFKNVLFGAALTNRPFIKGMSPINLSELRDVLEKETDLGKGSELSEDLLKLKEGDKVKTDAEIMKCKDEELSPEEKARKKEIISDNEVKLAKKKLSEVAKALGLAEDTPVEGVTKKLQETMTIGNDNTQMLSKLGLLFGLGETPTNEDIYAAAEKAVATSKNAIKGNARMLSERAKKVNLKEEATEEEVAAEEKKLAEKQSRDEVSKLLTEGNVAAMEKKLAELKEAKADELTVKLLEENITSRKKLAEEKLKSAKDKIELKLKEHFRSGKLSVKERDVFKAILFAEAETEETTFKLSEKDKDGKDVEAVKTLAEIIDKILTDRPAIVELKELAEKELKEPPAGTEKELSEEETKAIAARTAGRVTKATKTNKALSEKEKK